jgi:hypothetical protein
MEDYPMYTNISNMNRAARIVLSLGLVFAVLNATGPLGALVALPFISIYAGITGFVGWDPVSALASQAREASEAKSVSIHQDGLAAH